MKLSDILVPDPVAGEFAVLKDPRYVGDVLVGGTPSAGKVLTATSGTAASWQTPSGGGGGLSIATARIRVVNDDLSGLPGSGSWAIVQTSVGTKLQCSIAAAVGDRIRVCPNFLYVGSHYLDWTILDGAGDPDDYATSESSSPPTEGNPAMYPTLTISKMASSEMFTVGPGHLNAGLATIALAHQGAGTGPGNRVYAHTTYPWRLRLENIGPEPA
ncbi:hypothetical protein [Streptomyces sp. SID13726]|uniref:hypothetical protein n=1 Tax=Streptomyces sp. SID13726 TaxID=2706058 RepID=UPI0013BB51F0|nr:hypothetical protein [Streptomyces sp. SID13726]NEB05354.1 hypothetical protein [Streptomyces sp. SID13726]